MKVRRQVIEGNKLEYKEIAEIETNGCIDLVINERRFCIKECGNGINVWTPQGSIVVHPNVSNSINLEVGEI